MCSPGCRETRFSLELVTNGGFETGDYAPWVLTRTGDSEAFIRGNSDIPDLFNPPILGGSHDSYFGDQSGPSFNNIVQTVLVPEGTIEAATLSFQMQYQNFAVGFFIPNQQIRVSVAGSVLFETLPGDPSTNGPITITVDATALLQGLEGTTVDVVFEQEDDQGPFAAIFDDISLFVEGISA